ncbi:MAG: DEAD/DEAH box helicase, partial [Ignavibacteriales bacterium]|nr:DEAD/DEAH box helicase [Ignavibacteriales bacterium]
MSIALESIFSPHGSLAARPGYEYRRQQREMALVLGHALESKEHIIIEAPTGVGKSLAYLIPAILHAKQERRKAVISTNTKNLQDQLLSNDLPIARSLVAQTFEAVQLKGRSNYVCTTRLANALRQRGFFDPDEQAELKQIKEWTRGSHGGDMDLLPFKPSPRVRVQIQSEKGACSSTICGSECFFQAARVRARQADLVIVNHALFFSLFGMRESNECFLFPDDFIILDEAHMIEQVAGAAVGKSISLQQTLFAIRRLFHPKTGKGLLARIRKKGVRELCESAETAVHDFFDEIEVAARVLGNETGAVRVRRPFLVKDSVTEVLGALHKSVKDLRESIATKDNDELAAAERLVWEARTLIREFLEMGDASLTYWVEVPGGRSANIRLCAAPTSVAEAVGERLFGVESSVVMVGATLGIGASLRYLQDRIGAQDVRTLVLDSPFDHWRQMRLVLVRDIPSPEEDGYAEGLGEMVYRSVLRSQGRALVLFTSERTMLHVAELVRERLESEGILVLVQDGGTGRNSLLKKFREDIHSTLFGLDSFWMGVDVPGEALEHVIITRLPFAVPTHPLTEARMELINRRGGNTFLEYTLPEAILKFRQGVGRLIRTSTDKGLVTILDSRILRKSYGKEFLRALPRCPVEILKMDGSVL